MHDGRPTGSTRRRAALPRPFDRSRSTTTPRSSAPKSSAGCTGPSTPSRSAPARRSSSTPRSSPRRIAAATEPDAIALIDQWGVGRQGFDDGMAIFFNLDRRVPRPGAAVCGARLPRGLPHQRRAPGHLRGGDAAAPARVRLRLPRCSRPWRHRRRGHRRARAQPAAGAPGRCRGRAHRGAAAAGRPGRLGRLVVAALRARPGSTSTTTPSSCRHRRRACRRRPRR